ncbi:non-homologous end-joining factor 1 isoform X3 [Aquila chrysaetos chrysaetos]|uniref:non-homologous end-joining factor 1 isoform X3 n=1 Tax=Aquila chrysaetos chrysaetos TaxID=223781 RepID=UPI001176A877|nr:non-homologous end-joining factor 1 isoform X3 [Aquila chrysaetos chrysaetos]
MEGSEELESSLLTKPWASVCFGESAFLAKVCFRDTGYILLISDLSSVWYESADAEAVGQRSKELNKRLTVHVSSFLHHLCDLMSPLLAGQSDTATSFSCHHTAGGLSLHVKSTLSGLPFYWKFHCCPAPVEMVSRHLVRPLIRMSLALQYQVQELTFLLLQKDAEIEDYRENGATLSRDRLRTEPFQEEMFQQNFMAEGPWIAPGARDSAPRWSWEPSGTAATTSPVVAWEPRCRERRGPGDKVPFQPEPWKDVCVCGG